MRRGRDRSIGPGRQRRPWILIGTFALLSVGVGVLVLWEGLWGWNSRRWRVDGATELAPEQDTVVKIGIKGQDKVLKGTHFADAGEQHDELHPIEQLIAAAEKRFALQLATQTTDLLSAAQAYRKRRRRHPPPGFDAWYKYAQKHDAIIIESFFDSIYDDLAPFWGEDVYNLRRTVQTFSPKISIRNDTVDSIRKNSYKTLADMVTMIQELLSEAGVTVPDMDIPFNTREEVGMLVSFEDIDTALEIARPMMLLPKEVEQVFSPMDDKIYADAPNFDPEWLDGRLHHSPESKNFGPRPFWQLLQRACGPKTPSRKSKFLADIWSNYGRTLPEHSAAAMLPRDVNSLQGSFGGYVANWTDSRDTCQMPWLQGLHGAFVAPEEMSVTRKLFPFWSASKMSVSNEVLVPSPCAWNVSTVRDVQATPWEDMQDKLYWRGPATGGKNLEATWRRFHRHRFVAMLNATHVEIAEGLLHEGNETMIGLGYAQNFRLLPGNPYKLRKQRSGAMAEWVDGWADAAFTDLHCGVGDSGHGCNYTNEYFAVANPSDDLIDPSAAKSKYAMVVDGNGGDDEGEFTKVLRSGRLAIKSSVYKHWFDGRVTPWVHFVPLDSTMVDLYGVMEYFLGESARGGRGFAHAHVELPKHEHHFQTPQYQGKRKGRANSMSEGQGKKDLFRGERDKDGHDEAARKIAEAGQQWAAKTLRKEDMSVFMYRLLLEYARVVDVRRMRLAWVGDLTVGVGNANSTMSTAGATQQTHASDQLSIPPM